LSTLAIDYHIVCDPIVVLSCVFLVRHPFGWNSFITFSNAWIVK